MTAASRSSPAALQSGFRIFSGEDINAAIAGTTASTEDAIIATPNGNQATAYPLVNDINRITVCATNGDSVKLPPSSPGLEVIVINDGAATCQVYGFGIDTIDAVATATGVTVSNARRTIFWCAAAGAWQSGGLAKST